MALTLAIPLSGLDIYQFHSVHRKLCRSDIPICEQLISPSTRSDSSGISSFTTITDIQTPSLSPISDSITPTDDNSNSTNINHRPRLRYSTPTVSPPYSIVANFCGMDNFYRRVILPSVPQTIKPIAKPQSQQSRLQSSRPNQHLRVIYEKRDILNLGANVREPSWQMRTPALPNDNFTYYTENKSIYHRLSRRGLTKEYPMKYCQYCYFSEPSLNRFDNP